jgi:hypothetical protein
MDSQDRWLSAPNESHYGITEQCPADAAVFDRFVAVAQHSQPLIGNVFFGPLKDLGSRLAVLWDAQANPRCLFYQEKRSLIIAAARYLGTLPILQTEAPSLQLQQVTGQQFLQRPSQPRPFQIPILKSKQTLRAECYEVFYIITRLFHSAGVVSQPPLAPQGPIPYIPYYAPQPEATALPKRKHATDLARIAFHFRRCRGLPDWKQPLTLFKFTRRDIRPPCPEQVDPLTKQYYQQGAGVDAGTFEQREKTPVESAIMYFVAKLMEIRDAEVEVRAP